MKKFTKISILC